MRSAALFRSLLFGSFLSLAACGPTPQAHAPAPAPARAPAPAQPAAQAVPTTGNIPAVVAARAQAQQQPGALSAYQLARAVHDHAQAGYYAERNSQLLVDATDAIRWLKAARPQNAQERALLESWIGVLHLDLGRREAGIKELEAALLVAPINLAAGALVNQYAARDEMAKLFELCKRVAPTLPKPEEIYQLTDHCMRSSRATSREAALAWAPPELVSWFEQETQRRQALSQQRGQ